MSYCNPQACNYDTFVKKMMQIENCLLCSDLKLVRTIKEGCIVWVPCPECQGDDAYYFATVTPQQLEEKNDE